MRAPFKFFVVMCLILSLFIAACNGSEEESAPTVSPAAEAERPATTVPEATTTPKPTIAPEPTTVPEETIDPETALVLNMIERVNAEDYAGAVEFVADDMMAYFVGMPPTGMEIYWGKEQFRIFLEECCTDQNFEWQMTPERVEDGVVYGEANTWMDFTRQLGVAPNTFDELFAVKDGKITLYVSTMTEKALANFKPALREVMPDLFEVALPDGELPVEEITVTFADGTCAHDGPMTLQAGPLNMNLQVQDQQWDKYAVSLFTLDEGKDLIDLMATTQKGGPPSWSELILLKNLQPNESQTYTHPGLEEGLVYMICWAGSPDIPIGNAGPFLVVKP